MPDDDILAQFQEFLSQKEANDKANAESEDFDVEIWDESGRGVRTKRSHAKPFLQSLGLDVDPEPDNTDAKDDDKDKGKSKTKPTGKTAVTNPAATSVRKYFTKPTK